METYTDDNGNRVVVRHVGPPGRGIPGGGTAGQILIKDSSTDYDTSWATAPDGTDAVTGPEEAVDGNFALFDGITGKLIKDSARSLSFYASTSSVANKVDKVTGKGLSAEDFTTEEKEKLAALSSGGFRGSFEDIAALEAFDFDPVPQPGDYCYIEVEDEGVIEVLWDSVNEEWLEQTLEPVDMTGAEIATATFNSTDALTYSQPDCRIYTSGEKAQLASLVSFSGLVTQSYGSLSYFDMTGVAVTIVTMSDGSTNMVKIPMVTTVTGLTSGFDNGGSNDGRLRYTATTTRIMRVTAKVSFIGASTDVLVFGIAKNGTVDATSKVLVAMDATGTVDNVTLSAVISLASNDYLEVFVGNTTDTSAPTVKVLSIEANSL